MRAATESETTSAVRVSGDPAPDRSRPPSPRALWMRHAPAVLTTALIAGALLVTRSVVVTMLDGVGASALVPLAEGIFGPPAQEGSDKVVHAVLFFLHAATLVRSFKGRTGVDVAAVRSGSAPVLLAGALSFGFGGVLEILQGIVGRNSDPWDLLANGAGVSLCVAWQLLRQSRRPSTR